MKNLLIASCLAVFANVAFALPKIEAVMNTATGQLGLPTGGALATILVSGFSDPPVSLAPGKYVATGLPLPNRLGGVQVMLYGGQVLAPLLSVWVPGPGSPEFSEIVFQVPLERNVSRFEQDAAGDLWVYVAGLATAIINPLPKVSAGGFFADANKYGLAQRGSDYTPVTLANPAHPGDAIIAYADDLFFVWPEPPMGIPAPLQPLITADPVEGFSLYLQAYPPLTPPDPISHQGGGYFPNTPPLITTFLGLAPGQLGIQQVNFTVPANQQPGDWALFFANGHGSASPYVLLPVR